MRSCPAMKTKTKLWTVTFKGGPKDGEVRKMEFLSARIEFPYPAKGGWIRHCYEYDNPDLEWRTITAIYKGKIR
jgi:hypothetical protein